MGMSLLELKTFSQAVEETKEKAAPTYKVWPIPLLAAPLANIQLITNPPGRRMHLAYPADH